MCNLGLIRGVSNVSPFPVFPTVRLPGADFGSLPLSRRCGKGCSHNLAFKLLKKQIFTWKHSRVEAAAESLEGDTILLDEDVQMLVQVRSRHNLIRVYEVARGADHPLAGARVLLLDKPGNIHSVYYKFRVVTGSYYDVFAVLPSLVPEGPLGIFGLGAGTAARILRYFWPWIEIHGWELDAAVVNVARQFFHLSELEQGADGSEADRQEDGVVCLPGGGNEMVVTERGKLVVHVGDALHSEASVEGGFAGIIVDLFAEGAVIAALQRPGTWQKMKHKLRPGGRIMVNCGGSCVEPEGVDKKNGNMTMLETIAALECVFPGDVHWKSLADRGDRSMDNCVAVTGSLLDLVHWKQRLPEGLEDASEGWKPVVKDDLYSNLEAYRNSRRT